MVTLSAAALLSSAWGHLRVRGSSEAGFAGPASNSGSLRLGHHHFAFSFPQPVASALASAHPAVVAVGIVAALVLVHLALLTFSRLLGPAVRLVVVVASGVFVPYPADYRPGSNSPLPKRLEPVPLHLHPSRGDAPNFPFGWFRLLDSAELRPNAVKEAWLAGERRRMPCILYY